MNGDHVEKSEFFLAQLMRHEGAKRNRAGHHVAYRCTAGALTIGYGHNLDALPLGDLDAKSVITDTRAREILGLDVARFAVELDQRLPWWRTLDAPRAAVLLNMAFNMGVAGLLTFQRTLLAVRRGRWDDARSGMLQSKWAGQVKGRAVELARQMESGQWPQTGQEVA